MSLQEFQINFVDSFSLDSKRHEIFLNYQRFLNDFSKEVTTDFVQWINGSFVTRKQNPRDIDFVTILDHVVFQEKERLIENKFRLLAAREIYSVDAYTIRKYPETHPKYNICRDELVYWNHWFSYSKKNQAKKKFSKGFVEIIFGDHV